MVPKLKDVLNILDEIAPSYAAEVWDNTGLQVGNLSQDIKKIFLALDPTIKAIKTASNRNAQLLITHHPLIFKSLSHLNQEVYPGNAIFEAFKKGISIVAAHTNLDVVQDGINDMLANLFGLQDPEVLQESDDLNIDKAGLGRIGYLSEPVRLSTMTEMVKTILGVKILMVSGQKNMKIKRVAVVGGSGGDMVSTALRKGADLLITGDISHHQALEAKNLGLALIDGGHFHTEKAALRLVGERLKDKFIERDWDVVIELYKDEKGPMRYE